MVDPAQVRSGCVAALLWDLDNVTPGNRLLPSLARHLMDLVGPACPMFAAGHQGVCRAVRGDLAALGVRVLPGTRRPEGADRALIDLAYALTRHRGVRHFFIASSDHAFAHVPRRATVTVLTLNPDLVSRRLSARAESVIVIEGLQEESGTGTAALRG